MIEEGKYRQFDNGLLPIFVDRARQKAQDTQATPNSRLALVILEYGGDLFREASRNIRGNTSISPYDFFIDPVLPPHLFTAAVEAIGFLMVGSLANAVEEAKRKGVWDNRDYIDAWDNHINSTPLEKVDTRKIALDGDTTSRLLSLLNQDNEGTLAPVFIFKNRPRLPVIVKGHLSVYHRIASEEAFEKAADFFIRASRQLNRGQLPSAPIEYVLEKTNPEDPPLQPLTVRPEDGEFLDKLLRDF